MICIAGTHYFSQQHMQRLKHTINMVSIRDQINIGFMEHLIASCLEIRFFQNDGGEIRCIDIDTSDDYGIMKKLKQLTQS